MEVLEDSREAVEDAPEAAEFSDADYEELEPRLKYQRVGQSNTDLVRILSKDFITCLAVHTKFITIGTNWGHVYVLDLMGNRIGGNQLTGHSTTVNHLSIDGKGEFVASCSMDERIMVHNILNMKTILMQKMEKPIYSVAISPQFSSSNQSYITGDDRLILSEPGFLKRQIRILSEGKSQIRSIFWSNNLVAWASEPGVKIYCLQERRTITSVPRPDGESDTRCSIQPNGDCGFVLAWQHAVRVCEIVLERASGKRIGQITSHFTFHLSVCGVSPFGQQLLLLSFRPSEKPQLHLVEPSYDTYVELSIEELKVRGFERYSVSNYRFEHMAGDTSYYVMCPKDIICAQERDQDDHIEWLLSKEKYKEALEEVSTKGGTARHTTISVGRSYIDFLLKNKSFQEAAELCKSVLKSKDDWESMVLTFHSQGNARALAKVLPTDNPLLEKSIYDTVLNELLLHDCQQFHELVSSWPASIFSVDSLSKIVKDHLSRRPNDEALNRCQAKLFELAGMHEETLKILLKLRSPDIFELVQKRKLYNLIVEKLELLFSIDHSKTLQMLLDQDKLSVDAIISKLGPNSQLQCAYLDAQYAKDPTTVQKHYDTMIALYATHSRAKLLPFLRSASGFSLEAALDLCIERQLTNETVFLLARVGRRREALELLLDYNQYERVVEFCREESDPELWKAAVQAASSRPRLITELLNNAGSEVDPSLLIQRIKSGVEVPNLRDSIVKLLSDYRVGIALTTGCATILSKDCDALLVKHIRYAQRPLRVDPNKDACMRCRSVLVQSRTTHQQLAALQLAIFNCGHCFHAECVDPVGVVEQLHCPACAGLCF